MPRVTLLSLLLVACAVEETPAPDVLIDLEEAGPASVELSDAVGVGGVTMPVRLVNRYGATTPGTTVDLSVTTGAGPSTVTVTLDGTGVGLLDLDLGGPGAAEITVTGSADGAAVGATAMAWQLQQGMPDYEVGHAAPLDGLLATASLSETGTRGMALATGSEIWWQPADPGQPAYRVADLDFDITGMTAAHVDADGVRDLVVWAGAHVALLRGHTTGGYAWQGGWQARAGTVVGVAVDDLNGDRLTDIAVATSGDNASAVQVMEGDGAWSFSPALPLELTHELLGLSATNEGGDDRPDVSLLDASDGSVRRYTLDPEGWAGAATFELTAYEADPGARMLPQSDLNGDGTLELIIVGTPSASSQDLVFYVLDDIVTHFPLSFGAFYAGLADMNGDGATDILAMEDDTLHLIHWDGTGFMSQNVSSLGLSGPVAGIDYTGDGIGDLLIATDAVDFHPGEVDDAGTWTRNRFNWRAYATALTGPMIVDDIDGDSVADILGVTVDGSDTVLATWRLTFTDTGDGQLTYGGKETLGAGLTAHDMVWCGADAYVVTDGGAAGGNALHRIALTLSEDSVVPQLVNSVDVTGEYLACGTLDDGTQGLVVATPTGFWTTFSESLAEKASGDIGGIGDVALADPDGDGLSEVLGCTGAGCSILAIDLDGDGIDTVIRSGTTVSIDGIGGSRELPGTGALSVADLDGDGAPDVIAADATTGRFWIYRNAGGALAHPLGMQTEREFVGPLLHGDMTGDGIPELIFADTDGRTVHSGATDAGEEASW